MTDALDPDGLPELRTPVPGPRARALVDALARFECPAITARRARRAETSGAPQDPIVWARARGSVVEDADGNRYVDLTAGFGVAAAGHAHPALVAAIAAQSASLVHALGDVHPSVAKIALLERLASLAPWPDAQIILGLNGSDAVEAALKTALLFTGRPGVVAFEGGYHGLAHGPLAACGYREDFRAPFAAQLNPHVRFVPFPVDEPTRVAALGALDDALWAGDVGLLLLEPIQARGGVRVAPDGALAALCERARAGGALVACDEIFTGLGRTGARWASAAQGIVPDILCAGKALGGGMPLSACLAPAPVMAAWGLSRGEALHTATFLGHPVSCAAALAALDTLEGERLAERAGATGAWLRERLDALGARHGLGASRGAGLLLGVPIGDGSRTLRIIAALLRRGFLLLPSGSDASVLAVTPPLVVARPQLEAFLVALDGVLAEDA